MYTCRCMSSLRRAIFAKAPMHGAKFMKTVAPLHPIYLYNLVFGIKLVAINSRLPRGTIHGYDVCVIVRVYWLGNWAW